MKRLLTFALFLPLLLPAQTPKGSDVWDQLKYFEGKWSGRGAGEPGNSTVERQYEFVLGGTYLQVKNKSTFLPQEKNPKGEVHEDWGFFSRDKGRKLFVLRQFNLEGFVNQFIMDTVQSSRGSMLFTSEAIENIPAGWRAKEAYRIVSDDEFVETFSLAPPGKDYEVYVESRFKRIRK